jgi:hypothetical protein
MGGVGTLGAELGAGSSLERGKRTSKRAWGGSRVSACPQGSN